MTISGATLRRALTALAMRTGYVTFSVGSEGVKARAMDMGQLSIVEVTMRREAFTAFSCEKEFEAHVDVDALLDQLKNAGKADVTLEFHESEIALQRGKTRYTAPYVDEKHVRKVPKLTKLPPRNARVAVDGEKFRTFVTMLAKVASEAEFAYELGAFTMKAYGNFEKVKITLTGDEAVELEGDGRAKSVFSVELLKEVAKVAAKDDLVTIEIGTNVPGVFRVESGGVEINHVLAPRIVEEE